MHYKAIAVVTLLLASTLSAQTSDKVFDFTNKPGPQGLQEIATILRTVGGLQKLSVDPAASTVSIDGTSEELAMAGWMIHQADQKKDSPGDQFLVPGKSDDVIRVFFLANSTTPQSAQELLTVLRTVADVQKVFLYSATTALYMRGPAAQVALAAYLINSIDVQPDRAATSPEFQYTEPVRGTHEVVRVFHLANVKTTRGVQEILTVLRTVLDIQKVFNATAPMDLAIRGTASDLAASEWILKSLDIPADAQASTNAGAREFVLPVAAPGGSVIRVFYTRYLTPQGVQQTLTALRTRLQIQKVFNYSAPAALVVRGSADQITKAGQLIQDSDQQAKATP